MEMGAKEQEQALINRYQSYSLEELEAELKNSKDEVAKARLQIYVLERMIRAYRETLAYVSEKYRDNELKGMVEESQPVVQEDAGIGQK